MADNPIVGFTKDELTEMVRQILAEIPTSLPANGGNADTAKNANALEGLGLSEFLVKKAVNFTDANDATEAGIYEFWSESFPNLPYSIGGLIVAPTDNFILQINFSYIGSVAYRTRGAAATEWYEWETISTTQIKSVQVVGTTDNVGNFILWNSSENRNPVFITFADHYVIPFLASNGNYYAHVLSASTDEQLTNTAITATVFYIEI